MKQQVRLNVFETNSSTQHALVIKVKYPDGVPDCIERPQNVPLYNAGWNALEHVKMNTIEGRLLHLYNSILSWNGTKADLVKFLNNLDELGITYKLTSFNDDDSTEDEFPESFIQELLYDKEKFQAYVFAKDVFYDSFADDCGSYEQLQDWYDTIKEFSNGENTISLTDRC